MVAARRFIYHNARHYLMLLPFFLLFVVFVLWPILFSVRMSFTDWDGVHEANYVGWESYTRVIESRNFDIGVRNLRAFVTLAVPLGILSALGLAILVSRFTGFWHQFFRAAYFMPFVIPLFLAGVIWRWMLTPEYGIIPTTLARIGLGDIRWLTDPDYMIYSVVMVDLWRAVGFNMVLLLAGIKAIPKEYYEAARVDGANSWREIRHITIPLLEPVLFLVIVNAFISTLQMFDVPWLLSRSDYNTQGGPRRGMMFPVMDMMGRAFGRLRFGEASAYAVMLLVITLSITVVLFVIRWRYSRR